MSRPAEHLLTEQQYLEHELASDVRHEFVGGQMYAMAAVNVRHARLVRALMRTVEPVADRRGCDVFSESFLLRTEVAGDFRNYYPDLIVQCVPVEDPHWCSSPVLLVEVLSPRTAELDRREKRLAYLPISTLREYLLVSQDRHEVEVWRRDVNGVWSTDKTDGQDAVLHMVSIDVSVELGKLYKGVFDE